MKRIPWWRLGAILTLLAGLGLGLAYSWVLSPTRVVDAEPIALRADFKDQYRSAIAAAFAGTGDLNRAQARLALLGDVNSIEVLNAQAQQMLANGETIQQANEVAALAAALESGNLTKPSNSRTAEIVKIFETSTFVITPTQSSSTLLSSETPQPTHTQTLVAVSTPRPTRTPVPTLGSPFALTGQETVCDTNLPDGLLQVLVLNSNRRQVAGVEIHIAWDGGEEQFFTGLKPELGNGYADFNMIPNIIYTLQLASGSDTATGLMAPACQMPNGDPFFGSVKLTFQQP
jgi:hypothetical protein